jgi:hypothetical protein
MEWNTVNGSSRAGHNPVQALARVNRVHGEKPGGRVVDLRGLADPLGDALATYRRAGGAGQAVWQVPDQRSGHPCPEGQASYSWNGCYRLVLTDRVAEFWLTDSWLYALTRT